MFLCNNACYLIKGLGEKRDGLKVRGGARRQAAKSERYKLMIRICALGNVTCKIVTSDVRSEEQEPKRGVSSSDVTRGSSRDGGDERSVSQRGSCS